MAEKRSFTVLTGHCLGGVRGDTVEGAVLTIPEDLTPAEAATKLGLGYIEEIPVVEEEKPAEEEIAAGEETPAEEETAAEEEIAAEEETTAEEESVEREAAAGEDTPASSATPGKVQTGDRTPEHGDPAPAKPARSGRKTPRSKK